jgi:hypothetical protein
LGFAGSNVNDGVLRVADLQQIFFGLTFRNDTLQFNNANKAVSVMA